MRTCQGLDGAAWSADAPLSFTYGPSTPPSHQPTHPPFGPKLFASLRPVTSSSGGFKSDEKLAQKPADLRSAEAD